MLFTVNRHVDHKYDNLFADLSLLVPMKYLLLKAAAILDVTQSSGACNCTLMAHRQREVSHLIEATTSFFLSMGNSYIVTFFLQQLRFAYGSAFCSFCVRISQAAAVLFCRYSLDCLLSLDILQYGNQIKNSFE
jgi:hypothetical protein